MEPRREGRHEYVGEWTEDKLAILEKFARAYSLIFNAERQKRRGFETYYLDGFASSGISVSRRTGGQVLGSALRVLDIEPGFDHYYFIDKSEEKVAELRRHVEEFAEGERDVHVLVGDCNDVLVREVIPLIEFKRYRRAFCFLDPYGMHLRWEVIQAAGDIGTIDLLVNVSTMDMNMNVLLKDPGKAKPSQVKRMNDFWPDDSWRSVAYRRVPTLFDDIEEEKVRGNQAIMQAFRGHLKKTAGFKFAPNPIPMKNQSGAEVYYLAFASQNFAASQIVTDIVNTMQT